MSRIAGCSRTPRRTEQEPGRMRCASSDRLSGTRNGRRTIRRPSGSAGSGRSPTESVPGNHLPQALRCARSSPGCGSRALRKQYGPGRTRRPGPRQPDSPSLPDAVHEYRHRFPEGIFQTSCDDAALHGGRIGDREVIGLITVKHASGKEERVRGIKPNV